MTVEMCQSCSQSHVRVWYSEFHVDSTGRQQRKPDSRRCSVDSVTQSVYVTEHKRTQRRLCRNKINNGEKVHKRERVTAVRVRRPLAKKSVGYTKIMTVNSNRGRITYRM